jgi:hypothetical protein
MPSSLFTMEIKSYPDRRHIHQTWIVGCQCLGVSQQGKSSTHIQPVSDHIGWTEAQQHGPLRCHCTSQCLCKVPFTWQFQ